MNPIEQAAKLHGSQASLAGALGVEQPTVSQWATGKRPVPASRCVDIERITNGAVRRWHMRPEDWHRIWPELINTDGAPPAPTEERDVA